MAHGTGTLCIGSHTKQSQHATRDLKRRAMATWHHFWERKAQRASALILRSLDDRTLSDIGIARSEIESVVRDTSGQRRRTYDPRWE